MTKTELKIWKILILTLLSIVSIFLYSFGYSLHITQNQSIRSLYDLVQVANEDNRLAEWTFMSDPVFPQPTVLTPLQLDALIRAMEDTEISYTGLSDPPPTDGILHLLLRGNTGEPFHFVLLPDGHSGYTIGNSPYFVQFKEEESAFLFFFKAMGAII